MDNLGLAGLGKQKRMSTLRFSILRIPRYVNYVGISYCLTTHPTIARSSGRIIIWLGEVMHYTYLFDYDQVCYFYRNGLKIKRRKLRQIV